MRTHNVNVCSEIRKKIIKTLQLEKVPYMELCVMCLLLPRSRRLKRSTQEADTGILA